MARIQLISGPRNISTALMYSFGNRPDFTVVDEPLYAYYLEKTGITHPGREDILRSMSTDGVSILDQLKHKVLQTDHMFIKNMAHHFIGIDKKKILSFKNVFLIRNTSKILASFSKVIDNPTLKDIGIQQEWTLFQFLQSQNIQPIVIDSGLLLENPSSVLKQLCEGLNIEMDKKMLSWKPGPRKEDGIWAPYWYSNVHKTTGFKKQTTSSTPLPEKLYPVYEEADYYYQKLLAYAITP